MTGAIVIGGLAAAGVIYGVGKREGKERVEGGDGVGTEGGEYGGNGERGERGNMTLAEQMLMQSSAMGAGGNSRRVCPPFNSFILMSIGILRN